jgi:hypothetical protein
LRISGVTGVEGREVRGEGAAMARGAADAQGLSRRRKLPMGEYLEALIREEHRRG